MPAERARRYALKVYYNGRGFSGSQRQPGRRTVEGEILKSLDMLGIRYTDFKAAGRTDKGVSALGNVIAFTTSSKSIKPGMLNSHLPADIRVLAAREVDGTFNPRHAIERTYRYFLLDTGYDVEHMKKAAACFAGSKSFHNFSTSDHRDPVRRVNSIGLERSAGMIIITVSAESFLWQMVRRIVTAIKKAGLKELEPESIKELFNPTVDSKILPAEAENLVLWSVKYDFHFRKEDYSIGMFKKQMQEELEDLRIRSTQTLEMIKEHTGQ